MRSSSHLQGDIGKPTLFFSGVAHSRNYRRELAFQIHEQFAVLGAPLKVKTAVIVGGMDMIAQALELWNRPHVIVATPGRLVDHIRSGAEEWNLSRVKFLANRLNCTLDPTAF
jgi:superfamily II DNA/RNA helicase